MLYAWDFETEEIQDFPQYPPKPVGLSIYPEDGEPRYYAFGHPVENNCEEETAKNALFEIMNNSANSMVAFNKPFDTLVAHVHWGLPLKPAATSHDAMILGFLFDPHARELGLKPLSAKHLDMPPDEAEEVRDWLVAHGICKFSKSKWGAHISKAPGELVGKYANGDTIRTLRLFKDLHSKLDDGMRKSYMRELQLQDIMLQNTLEGIPVNVEKLRHHIDLYNTALAKVDELIFELLGCSPFNINSGAQLADAIDRKIPGIAWMKTPKGARSTSKDSLEQAIGQLNGKLLACLQYRASVMTCLNTFMKVWYTQASHPKGDGNIHCLWHTTRSDDGGARTGRLSSSPNFQNIPTLKSAKFKQCLTLWEQWLKDQGYPALPNVREYIDTCDEDMCLVKRDFSSQELRVLAHYEDGALLEAYKKDPKTDMHQWARDTVEKLAGVNLTRKQTKTIAFAILYGSGLATLAKQMGSDESQAFIAKDAYLEAVPGIATLSAQLKQRAANGQPIRTWGGRVYYVEPPRYDKKSGRYRTFDYKLLNVLIQGSSADITKEAVIRYHTRKQHGRLLLTVHDEIVLLVPREHVASEMQILRECMDGVELDAPLTSDGGVGVNFHDLKDYND